MQITKVKLVRGGESVELSIVKTEANKSTTKANEEHSAPVHADFKAAMKSLAIHFAILADYIKPKEVKNIDKYDAALIEAFNVTGFSIKGDVEDKGVVITGSKIKSNGKHIIINTPFTRFIDAEESQYQFMEHLEARLQDAEREVVAYLSGKVAPEPQQSLAFPEDSDKAHNGGEVEEDDHSDTVQKVAADAEPIKSKRAAAKKKAAPKKKAAAKKTSPLKKVD